MRMAWMPSASSSATTTMIASSSSVPPADFLRLALLATGVFAVIRGRPLPCFRLVASGPRLYRLVRAQVAPLGHAGALAHAAAQVVKLGPTDVAARGHLDALNLRRVHGERAIHADSEGLLADGERLAHPVALALEHDALEDLGPAPRSLDDLEVHAHPVAGREPGHPPQLRALEAVDDAAHAGCGG